jgi:hypothetical protein
MNFFRSSANPENIALTLKGLASLAIPVIIFAGQHFGYSWSESQIAQVIAEATTIGATAVTLYGLGRKFYYYVKSLLS